MYGKVFNSIYDGTLYGHWQAIVTMQQLIVLANADGIVDMTPQAIAARTSIPLEIIAAGLKVLADPDPYTRTPGEDGRRIALIDDHRPWGWRLVNHGKYAKLRNMEQKREADRERIADKRKKINDVATESHPVAEVAHADADADADVKNLPTPNGVGVPEGSGTRIPECPHVKLVEAYHELLPMCPRVVDWTPARQAILRSRWREKAVSKAKNWGYTSEEQGLACWKKFFRYIGESEFLTGRKEGRQGKAPFVADLEWIVRPKYFVKIIEGQYHR